MGKLKNMIVTFNWRRLRPHINDDGLISELMRRGYTEHAFTYTVDGKETSFRSIGVREKREGDDGETRL